jgi:hypothetical protein
MLKECISQSIIVCYKEDVSNLERALIQERLNPTIQRATYSDVELTYTKNTRCFINHYNTWLHAQDNSGYTLICESDFVPCAGLGSFPVFWPLDHSLSWGYLYQGSPRLLAVENGYLRCHCAPLVAYVINASVAKIFIRFFNHEMSKYSPQDYFNFDSHLQWWTMGQGARAYMPMKHYGEHGGFANKEHASFGRLTREGKHRADNLTSRLSFLPHYARGSRFAFLRERVQYRTLGLLRLLFGRWIVRTNMYNLKATDIVLMYIQGLQRLLY